MEDKLVEVFFVTDPSKRRFVTKDAAEYMRPKWQRADSNGQEAAKKKDVVPVEDNTAANANLDRLRAEYKKIADKDADPDWTHARVHIEIKKIEASLINEVKLTPEETKETLSEPVITEAPEYAKVEPKKRGPKKKVTEETPA